MQLLKAVIHIRYCWQTRNTKSHSFRKRYTLQSHWIKGCYTVLLSHIRSRLWSSGLLPCTVTALMHYSSKNSSENCEILLIINWLKCSFRHSQSAAVLLWEVMWEDARHRGLKYWSHLKEPSGLKQDVFHTWVSQEQLHWMDRNKMASTSPYLVLL